MLFALAKCTGIEKEEGKARFSAATESGGYRKKQLLRFFLCRCICDIKARILKRM